RPGSSAGRGGRFFRARVWGHGVGFLPGAPGESPPRLRNTGLDFSGAALAPRPSDCSLRNLQAADVGQDFNFELDLRVAAEQGLTVEGGPYFRSRAAEPGDGIIGGTSAGFWVQPARTGQVRVMRLHPRATVAFSDIPPAHDSTAFHRLVASVGGWKLQVSLDGRLLEFDAGGARTFSVDVTPLWDRATPKGRNDGSAGIAFGAATNRGEAGGQEARNIRITPFHPLSPGGGRGTPQH